MSGKGKKRDEKPASKINHLRVPDPNLEALACARVRRLENRRGHHDPIRPAFLMTSREFSYAVTRPYYVAEVKKNAPPKALGNAYDIGNDR